MNILHVYIVVYIVRVCRSQQINGIKKMKFYSYCAHIFVGWTHWVRTVANICVSSVRLVGWKRRAKVYTFMPCKSEDPYHIQQKWNVRTDFFCLNISSGIEYYILIFSMPFKVTEHFSCDVTNMVDICSMHAINGWTKIISHMRNTVYPCIYKLNEIFLNQFH